MLPKLLGLFIKANEGEYMSHDYSAIKNKQPKVHFQEYLYNIGEPRDDISSDFPQSQEAELLEDSFSMRRRFRSIAERLRNRYP